MNLSNIMKQSLGQFKLKDLKFKFFDLLKVTLYEDIVIVDQTKEHC